MRSPGLATAVPLTCRNLQRVVDELNRSVSSLERLRDEFEYRDPQGKDHVSRTVRKHSGEPDVLGAQHMPSHYLQRAENCGITMAGIMPTDASGGFIVVKCGSPCALCRVSTCGRGRVSWPHSSATPTAFARSVKRLAAPHQLCHVLSTSSVRPRTPMPVRGGWQLQHMD